MHSPRSSYLNLALCMLRYLKGNPEKGICISKVGDLRLKAFVDVTRVNILALEYCGFL